MDQEELEHFVGMDDDIKKLISLLVSDQESGHRVIGVWGMGGSGKTTVAKKVYKHADVRRFFDSFAWVCITRKCQIKNVKQDIFRQLLPAEINEDVGLYELEEKIYSLQMEKKCLIVLDDIWERDDWKCLRKSIGGHSKVLLTTRNKNVADIGYPIKLNGFTEDEAWELLRMKTLANFKDKPQNESEYEKLGRMMTSKCDRLPLAVAVLGRILRGKNTLEKWKFENYKWKLENYSSRDEVKKVLVSSYDELPDHLKLCFLSLGFLREDAECESVEGIYELWMAEGLIEPKHSVSRKTMRDVAVCYLEELQSRSMVELADFWKLSLHDSILDLCLSEEKSPSMVQLADLRKLSLRDSILDLCRSKAKEEKFLKVVDVDVDVDVDMDMDGEDNDLRSLETLPSRLIVHVDRKDKDLDVLNAIKSNAATPLTSVKIVREGSNLLINLPKEIFNLPQFKSLLTLIVFSCHLRGKFFHRIKDLINLRLLRLIGCEWERFSLESVDKLSFLQTLDLSDTKIVSLMPLAHVDTFCKMHQLRHLYLPLFPHTFRIEGKLLRLMDLPQLETIYNFQSKFYDSNDLLLLEKVRTLRRCWVNDDTSLEQIINYVWAKKLTWIAISIKNCDLVGSYALNTLLKILNATLELQIESCILFKLPRLETVDFSKMRPGLVDLDLGDADIEEDIMPALEKFPNLKKLRLRRIRFGQKEMICNAGSFPRLEQLYFYRVVGTFEFRIDEAAMPNLSTMEILHCFGIKFTIPERVKKLLA